MILSFLFCYSMDWISDFVLFYYCLVLFQIMFIVFFLGKVEWRFELSWLKSIMVHWNLIKRNTGNMILVDAWLLWWISLCLFIFVFDRNFHFEYPSRSNVPPIMELSSETKRSISAHNELRLLWVPDHSDILGNEMASIDKMRRSKKKMGFSNKMVKFL